MHHLAKTAVKQVLDVAETTVGRVAEVLLPQLAHEVERGQIDGRVPRLRRAIRRVHLDRAGARADTHTIEHHHRDHWSRKTGFYDHREARGVSWFFEKHYVLFEALERHLEAAPQFTRLVEIGCGSAFVTAHCAERLASLERIVGLDINTDIIHENRKRFQDVPVLSFFDGDCVDWVTGNPSPGTALLSNGGVMEYIAPERLTELFRSMATHGPASVALIEPVSPSHDFAREADSFAFGRERSFSHNHRHLLESSGFDVIFSEELSDNGVRWVMMLATTSQA